MNHEGGWGGIRNRERLLDHGVQHLRKDAIDILEHAIRAADPYVATREVLSLDGDQLRVGSLEYDLREWRHVYVVGAGKATQGIALALEETLGERISDGIVVLKYGERVQLRRIRVVEAAHPVPDRESHRGAREVLEIAKQAEERDLVFSAITGGSSALLVLPPEGVTLDDLQVLNQILLTCGASIREINAVRKHVSRVKGGRLAQAIFPAEVINLTVSDVVGDPLDYITGPTVPDTSTFGDAWDVLDSYDLWGDVPNSVSRHLRQGPVIESPKAFSGRYHSIIVVPGDAACLGAKRRSEAIGYSPHVVTTEMEGESSAEAAAFVASSVNRRHSAVIAGGETTVTIEGEHGEGGPNQEFALAAAVDIEGRAEVVVGSVDTDGTDGPTEAAGGLVDGETVERGKRAGCRAAAFLERHASLSFLDATGDLVMTGPTGTNVNDLKLLLTGGRRGAAEQ